jgi:DNA-binding XRE family transcriptional regulator
MDLIMGRMRSETTTPLSAWLARNEAKVSRDDFARRIGVARQHVDRHARGYQRPGLDLAFDIEDATNEISGGKDILKARDWWQPPAQRLKSR